MEDKLKNMEKWPKYCLAKSDKDGSCADDAIMSPIAYLGNDWTDRSQEELDQLWINFKASP